MDIRKKKPKRFKSNDDKFPKPNETVVATAVKRNSFFFVAFGVGLWNKNTLRVMFNQFENHVQPPSYKRKLEINSDGNDDYTFVLPEYYHEDSLCYGQYIKTQDGKKIFPPIRRAIFGCPKYSKIHINTNECFNGILREHLSRLVRKSKCHSKDKYALEDALWVFQFYWNFMHELHKKVTPAIMEKQASKVWTWGNFLHTKLSYGE